MAEIEISGHKYKTGRLDARKQNKIAKRLLPALNDLREAAKDLPAVAEGETDPAVAENFLDKISQPLTQAIHDISDEDLDFITDTCLAVCERASGGGWAPVLRGGNRMFQDMKGVEEIGIVIATVQENLSDFFSSGQPDSSAAAAPQK